MKLELRKKLSNDGWIKLNKDQKIKIDYPTLAQHTHLANLLYHQNMMEFYKYLIKYTIKDWEGIEVKCELKDNELTDELLDKVCFNVNQTTQLATLINKEIEFLDIDLKK